MNDADGPKHRRRHRDARSEGSVGGYVELNGLRTWYHGTGAGEPLVLLHPGGVDSRAFAPNIGALSATFRVFTPDRRGHGRTPDLPGPITYELMAEDTIAFVETVIGGSAHIAGMSAGAVVALHVALRRPDLVRRLVLVAGVFHRAGWLPGVVDPAPEPPAFFAELHGEVSPDGPEHYPEVAAKLARLNIEEPTLTEEDLARVAARTLVMAADDDEVTLEHTIACYRAIPDAELAIIPGTSHALLVEKPQLCNTLIVEFLANEPVPTLAPIRRGRASGERPA